jgi:ribosomal protein S18
MPAKKTGLCRKHQRKLAQAIKRARYMGLISYVPDKVS